MSEQEPDDEKHVTAAAASKPEEEFIEQKPQPSRDEDAEAAQPAPPKSDL